ncbi:hypothetical protein DFO52_10855 [Enterobacter sp. AG326]|jgi:hypothetical protein|nr:hypothetical protein DFO52_10855 [Enterobacter sp. AG326]
MPLTLTLSPEGRGERAVRSFPHVLMGGGNKIISKYMKPIA